jgi:hypothetical protein
MSLLSFVTNFEDTFFRTKEPKIVKINPTLDVPDLEPGDYYKLHPEKKSFIELRPDIANSDLEIGKGPYKQTICGEVSIDINGLERCNVIENYVSFIDCINYLSTPLSQRSPTSIVSMISSTFSFDGTETGSQDNLHTSLEDRYEDISLHL